MKKAVFALSVLLMMTTARSAIVFDGTNSYSSYTGKPSVLKRLLETESHDTIRLLKLDDSQIDYTTPALEKKSRISDPRGMIIEAEGLYSIKILSFSGRVNFGSIRTCDGGNGFALGTHSDSVFEYKIEVRTPGIYTFAIDAAGERLKSKLEMYGLQEHENTNNAASPLATWTGSDTGSWINMVQNFGGPNKESPYSVDVELGKQMRTLVFAMGPNFNMDCIRITGFKPLTARQSASTDDKNDEKRPVSRLIVIVPILVAISLVISLLAHHRKKNDQIRMKLSEEAAEAKKNNEW